MIHEVRWDITGKCNLNCKHCQAAVFYREEKHRTDLTTDEVFRVIDKLKRAGVSKIGLLGGEPLLRKDIIQIIRYMKAQEIKTTINTNLLLLDNVDVDMLLENVEAIFVSLDGVSREQHEKIRGINTFDKTIENIKILTSKKSGVPIHISYVLNQYNYKAADEIYSFMKQLNVDTCLIDSVHRAGNADENWDELSLSIDEETEAIEKIIKTWDFEDNLLLNLRMYTNLFRDYLNDRIQIRLIDKLVWDAPGKTSFYILNDGTLVPTQFMMYMDKEHFVSKSLRDYEFDEIVTSDSFVEFLNLYQLDLPHTSYEPCRKCQYAGKQCNPSPVAYWLGKITPVDICNACYEKYKRRIS